MEKKIRSISISEIIDSKLIDDSKLRGLTISANLSRILFDYFKEETRGSGKLVILKYIGLLLSPSTNTFILSKLSLFAYFSVLLNCGGNAIKFSQYHI